MTALVARAKTVARQLIDWTWKFFTGGVVVIIAFAANFHDFKQPNVTVEITSVATISTDPIDLMCTPDLSEMAQLLDDVRFILSRRGVAGLPPDEIERQLGIRVNRFTMRKSEFESLEDRVNELLAKRDLTKERKEEQEMALQIIDKEFNKLFPDESELNAGRRTPSGKQGRNGDEEKRIRERLDIFKASLAREEAGLREAEKQWKYFKETVLPDKNRLVVTCAVGNMGAGATSLKPQGLLRANLGDGNYLDLLMQFGGYESSTDLAVLQTQSYKVVRFQSDELQSMNTADRQRFKTILGNVSPATLFIADVRGRTYQSNSVPFSPGVYEQRVYDNLKQFASKTSGRKD